MIKLISRNRFLLLLLLPVVSFAQNKLLTVEDAVMKQRTTLAPERLAQLTFLPRSHSFAWIGKKNNTEYLLIQQADNMKRDTIISFDELKRLMDATGTDVKAPERFPAITWYRSNEFRFMHANVFFSYNVDTKRMSVLNHIEEIGENADMDTNSMRVAFTQENNIMVYTPDTWGLLHPKLTNKPTDGTIKATKDFIITMDGTYGLQNGKAVHRNEFGINKGIFWSPKGSRMAFYKMYEGMVTDYPLLDLESKPAHSKNIKYPMAGGVSHMVKVNMYDFTKKLTYPILTGDPADQYLTNLAFSPDEEYLYIAIVNRDQNEMKLNRYDAITGAFVKTLFTETDAKYVEPEHPMVFVKNNPRWFVWQSKRDGNNHLYLYDANGKLIRQLTKGSFDVTDFLGFDEKGQKAYYMAADNNGLDRQCYAVELESGKITTITRNPGVHQVVISDDGKYIIDSYSSTTIPRRVTLMDNTGLEKSILLQATNPLIDYKTCGLRLFTIPAADGTTKLNCRIIYPPQFDSTKKHPVLTYLYGGPHAQMITNSWLGGADMWLYYMAQQGYVVFTVDNRGSGNRGMAFEQATFRKLGTVEREDQLEGVNYLKKQKYVDASRMGIFGWSFGGFMSINMMTRTDAYKAAVAGGPVIDWGMYEIMYTERYMDKPQENPEGYKDADLTNYVKNLKGKLMLIHGTDDDVVLWQHSLTYVKKCIDEGIQVDYFVYPEHKHNVLGKDRVHLMQKVADYFKQNL